MDQMHPAALDFMPTVTPLQKAEAWARQPNAPRHASELVEKLDEVRELARVALDWLAQEEWFQNDGPCPALDSALAALHGAVHAEYCMGAAGSHSGTAPVLRAGDRVTVHGPGSSMTRGEVRALGNLSGPLVVVIASDEEDDEEDDAVCDCAPLRCYETRCPVCRHRPDGPCPGGPPFGG